jgi:hypothetical protein
MKLRTKLRFLKTKDLTRKEMSYKQEMRTDPEEVKCLKKMCRSEEEEQENHSQDDEAQDEHMPEDPGAELSGKYDFSAKRLEEYLCKAAG